MTALRFARRPLVRLIALRHWEWPTVAVAIAIYGGFALLTCSWHRLPIWSAAPLGAMLLAWHSSLQHETIHGHPTPSTRLNGLIGAPPLALWLPYALYRDTHLGHHRDHGRDLTDPVLDPESHYLRRGALAGIDRVRLSLLRWHGTLGGRLAIGPALVIGRCWSLAARRALVDRQHRWLWLRHSLAVVVLLVWIVGICRIPLAQYAALVIYPAIALGLVRSFVEHRAAPDPLDRTAVVEAGGFWSLLFLNNNLHVAHHREPSLPWYRIPAAWQRQRDHTDLDGALLFPGGYAQVFARHFFRAARSIEHPGFEVRP